MPEAREAIIIGTIIGHYPEVLGIYLFGSRGTQQAWPDLDDLITFCDRVLEFRRGSGSGSRKVVR
jgi:hypothetical protein